MIHVILEGDGCWPDLMERKVSEGKLIEIALLPKGTRSGAPTVTFRVDLPENKAILIQATVRELLTSVKLIETYCSNVNLET